MPNMLPAIQDPPIPVMLSSKYKRTMQNVQNRLAKPPVHSEDETPRVKQNSILPDTFITEQKQPIAQKTEDDGEKADTKELEALNESTYHPYQLGANSSYNPTKLTANQLKKLDLQTKAKYMAYEKPDQFIQLKIAQSEQRSKKWLREEHARIQDIVLQARKKWDLIHRAIEDPEQKKFGELKSLEAMRRIKRKKKQMAINRDEELQYLVEGQNSSIDAIQLKEHLVIPKTVPKVDKYITPKERSRVEELLSMDMIPQ
ncbi:hypothetical protein HK103_001500 [Boothiomyces macroporosus]|uniref:Uncharacterized protein n=1 Tax=Boothiomyces macroporosus TaxID=261099 RepID=A0AAD5UJQ3_9FUNG|nr:hypothetical protein HK103_001500 [Boothiomyces macroporosus]